MKNVVSVEDENMQLNELVAELKEMLTGLEAENWALKQNNLMLAEENGRIGVSSGENETLRKVHEAALDKKDAEVKALLGQTEELNRVLTELSQTKNLLINENTLLKNNLRHQLSLQQK